MLKTTFFLFAMALFGSEAWQPCVEKTLEIQAKLPGWCTQQKAEAMMELIHEARPQICVEVGVFGGSSLFPCAKALAHLGQGHLYGIDPWENEACLVGYQKDDPNYLWWKAVDLEKIYRDLQSVLHKHKLDAHCTLVRKEAREALKQFKDGSIDILHIDGNHTEQNAYDDARLYLPKVKSGGYIWFDDINWSTTRKAVAYLAKHCDLDIERSTNAYALFKKR